MEIRNYLPKGWIQTSIGEISDVNRRNPVIQNYSDETFVTFVPMAAVDAEKGAITTPQIRPLREVRKGFTSFANGDVIIAKITPCMENGKAAIAKELNNGIGFGSTEFHVMSPKNIVLSLFLYYFIRQESFRWDAKSNFSGTAGQLRVPRSFVENYPFPLPPLPEQERIVERIESLFTQLDAGVAGLKRLRVALKRYKASVLKAACEGRLVPQDPNDEPAEEMLKRLGKVPLDSYDLPELPKGWCWATLKNVTEPIQKINPKENPDKEFIYIDISSIDNNIQQIISPKYYIGADAPSRARQLVNANDVLFSTVRTYLKNISIVPEIYDKQVASTGFCVLRATSVTSGKYIFYFSQTDSFLNPLTELQRGTSYPAVRDSDVWEQSIPIPPFSEQERIVSVVEQHFSVIQELEQTIDANLKRAGRLRQSILKRAFEGKLVTPRVRATHTQTDETLESQPPAPDQPISSNTGSPQPAKSRK